jgi:hypothetical protein
MISLDFEWIHWFTEFLIKYVFTHQMISLDFEWTHWFTEQKEIISELYTHIS